MGVDSTTLEANAAMKTIVRRNTGEDWKEYVTRLMREGEIDDDDEPTDEDIRRFDKRRKNKKVSNDEWVSPTDPDSRITQMKDGRTHLAYKAEHVVDLDNDLILAAEIRSATDADTATLVDSVLKSQENLQEAGSETAVEEVAADKGYHATATLELATDLNLRTYIPEPRRPRNSKWMDKADNERRAVLNNRRLVRRSKSKRLQRRRSECCERTFAHICDSGGMRRSWLRGLTNVRKRYSLAADAHNLGRILRKLLGVGKPRGLHSPAALSALIFASLSCLAVRLLNRPQRISDIRLLIAKPVTSTGC